MARPRQTFCLWMLGLSLTGMTSAQTTTAEDWVGAWSAAPIRAPIPPNIQWTRPPTHPSLHAQTVREFVRVSASGTHMRIHLDNRFGQRPVVFGRATIARALSGSLDAIDSSSLQSVTFHGTSTFTLLPGDVIDSDPVRMTATSGERFALSLYVPGSAEVASWHLDTRYQQSLSAPGDHANDARFADAQHVPGNDWLSRIDVLADASTQAIVSLGDSITNGYHASPEHSYPEQLSERLRMAHCARSVLNAGIDGNQVAAGLGNFAQGDSMRDRLHEDVLAMPGVRYVVLLGGINDIGEPTMAARNANQPLPDANAMAMPVIQALQAIATRIKAAGRRVYGATILPFGGTQGAYTSQGDIARQMINTWIRHHAPYDAIIDFDAVIRDEHDPTRMQTRYDSGDHIHPNDDGYRAMANAIPLTLFGCDSARPNPHAP